MCATMAIERALLSVLLCVTIFVGCLARQNTYYITPTPDTPCPGHQEPCHTLSEYAASGHFNNLPMNAMMKFLPGNHTLETAITLANLTSLAVLGDSSSLPEVTSRIVCTWPAGFAFTDITELHINALTFISCGHNDVGALNITSVAHSYISLCVFDGNYARNTYTFGGAIAINGGVLILTSNVFQDHHTYQGGAIYAQHSTLSLTGNTFQSNFAHSAGGAITAVNTTLDLTTNVFQGNHANQGGAILTQFGILSLTNNTFKDNFAAYEGGAILAGGDNTLILVITNVFHGNSAYRGGAITAYSGILSLARNTFQDNSAEHLGGAIAALGGSLNLTTNVFQGNSAYHGGAINAQHSFLGCTNNTFQSNSAKDTGGAIVTISNTLNLTTNVFQGNSAQEGGAIIALEGILGLTNNTFQSNSAKYAGGAIVTDGNTLDLFTNVFQNNSAEIGGGAVAASYCTLILTTSTFQGNSAYQGGAIDMKVGTFSIMSNAFQNNNAKFGGAISATNSKAITPYNAIISLTKNTFQNNSAETIGGAIVALDRILNLTTNVFQGNAAHQGGAINAQHGILGCTNNTFQSNSANYAGGAILTISNTLDLVTNVFQGNSAENFGGAVDAVNCTLILTTSTFQGNSAYIGGAIDTHNGTFSIVSNTFQNNDARVGGAISASYSGTHSLFNNTFQGNSAEAGGAMAAVTGTLSLRSDTFQNNSAYIGGALYIVESDVTLTGNDFYKNSAKGSGGALATYRSSLSLGMSTFQNSPARVATSSAGTQLHTITKVTISGNTAAYGGGLYVFSTTISGSMILTENSATEGGAISTSGGTSFFLSGTTTIINNSARIGGGLMLSESPLLYLPPNTTIRFINNTAQETGGAIHQKEIFLTHLCDLSQVTLGIRHVSKCFFQVELLNAQPYALENSNELQRYVQSLNSSMYFENNRAMGAGGDVFGALVDKCSLSGIDLHHGYQYGGVVFNAITNTPDITSAPMSLCICEGEIVNCNMTAYPQSVYPGGTVEIPVIALGQRDQPTIAIIHAVDISEAMDLKYFEYSQNISKGCNTLRYTIFSHAVASTQEMTLYADGPCIPDHIVTVKIDIQRCSPGFQLPQDNSSCVCAQRLQQYTNTCVIDDGKVLRIKNAEFWVGYNDEKGLILHPHCPFDYCTSQEAYLEVTNSDEQCNSNRSGLLCGRCSESLSLVLGSSRCLQCSNSYLSLLAAFALAGIALILLLLLLRLTVASGTINGLIFYANIVTMNSSTLFRPKTTNVLTVFIAWLNLDLGIETCLYNGMDAYVKTWLQFAFPIYVWCLVGTMIVGCHYSSRLVKLLGRNPIAVLATLFLLSYAKLLRTAAAALSYTRLEYPNSQSAVWLYDGTIGYLSSKHIPLFIAAISCLIFFILPYTALLIVAQWLRAKSNWRVFSWMNNHYVVSFLDAYHAPYSTKHRYWFGLMLLLRFVLFLISAVNVLGDPRINLLAVSAALILTTPILTGTGIYKSWCLGLLEVLFLVNITALVIATLYIYPNEANQNAITFTSISIAFATFSGIVIYHAIQQIKATQLWRKLFVQREFVPVPLDDEGELEDDPPEHVYVPGCAPTQTVVDLRELCKECEATDIQEPCEAAELQEPHSGAEVQEPTMEIQPQDPRKTTELLEPVEALELQVSLDLTELPEPLEPRPVDLQESNKAAQLQGSTEPLEAVELQEQVEPAEPLEATEVQELPEFMELQEPPLKQCEAVEAVQLQELWGSTELRKPPKPTELRSPLEAMELWKAVEFEVLPLQKSWELEVTELQEPLLEPIELIEPLEATELLDPLERTELQAPQRGTELRESQEGTKLQELWMAVEVAQLQDLHESTELQEPRGATEVH